MKDARFTFKDSFCFKKKIISLSHLGKKLTDSVEDYINRRIINSYGVNRFDARAVYIVKQLFKAYYANPKQMPDGALDKLRTLMDKISYKVSVRVGRNSVKILNTNLRTGDPKHIDYLLSLLRLDAGYVCYIRRAYCLQCSHTGHRWPLC